MKQNSIRAGREKKRLPLSQLLNLGETVVLYGTRRMTVQGCRRILSYAPSEIRLKLKDRSLCVRGQGLTCISFSGGGATLQGEICGVDYLTREETKA